MSAIERNQPWNEIYDLAKYYLRDITRDVRDALVMCLAELNVLKVPLSR